MSSNSLKNGLLSLIIPGLGQALDGRMQKAVPLFLIALILHISVYFILNNPFGSGISTLYHIYAGVDAYDENTVKLIARYVKDYLSNLN